MPFTRRELLNAGGGALLARLHNAPTAKQRLAAIRMRFDWLLNGQIVPDWLVAGQIVPVSPAASLRESKHIVKVGEAPVLDPSEARALIDSIDVSTPV